MGSDENQCPSCGSSNIKFYEYRGLNLIYKCQECGLLFAIKDGELYSTLGVR